MTRSKETMSKQVVTVKSAVVTQIHDLRVRKRLLSFRITDDLVNDFLSRDLDEEAETGRICFFFLQTKHVQVWPEVIGYLGLDVTIPCHFIRGPNRSSITQLQWDLLNPGGNKTVLIVYSSQHGVNIHDSPLKGRVNIKEQTLIIRDAKKRDAGRYACTLSTFPSGSFNGETILIVKEKMPLRSGIIAATVIAVMLLVGILAAAAYLILIRHGSLVRPRVNIDTSVRVMDVSRRSVLGDEDVVYSDIMLKPTRDPAPSSSHIHPEAVHGDDVMYAEVVLRQQPK